MYPIKFLGVILIVICSSLIGVFKSRALHQRRKKLSMLLDGVNALYNHIEQGEFELKAAVKNAFCKCGFLNLSGREVLCADTDLKKDKALIEEFFASLGRATKKIECDNINHFAIKLKSCLKDAENDVINKSKIYRILGVCSGLVLGILFV